MYKTTKKDFAEFKKEAEYWIDYFGLKNWEITIEHFKRPENRAMCWVNFSGMVATLELSTEWIEKPLKNEIKKSAFHEVCELMIRPLSALAEHSFDKEFTDQKTHDIIRRLENTIFKEYRG